MEVEGTPPPSAQTEANVATQNKGNCKAQRSRWGSQTILLLELKEIEGSACES